MRPVRILPPLLLVAMAATCKIPVTITPAPAGAGPEEIKYTGGSVFVGVGDIAVCGTDGDERTAKIVDSILKADSAAKVTDEVFTLGDNAYPEGAASNFALCFAPSWGDSAKRIMKKIHPSPGNHEHQTTGAAPYYQYFGAKAGSSKKGYYSYDVGDWHAIVLNSEIIVDPVFSAADRKAQDDWLVADMKGTSKSCTLAYWHNPRYSSGWHGSDVVLQPLWETLYAGGVTLILNGHDHDYERFLPMNASGIVDSVNGMTEIIAGTGGGDLRGFRSPPVPHSATRIEGYWGVLKLTLGKGEFRSAFVDVNGRVWDPAGGKCRTAKGSSPAATPPAPASAPAGAGRGGGR